MRSKIVLLTLALALVAALSFAVTSRVTPVNAQGTACDDKAYLTGVGTDFQSLGADLKAVDTTKVQSLIAQELSISVLRQKYEDMANVPANCYVTNLYVLAYAANINDLLALQTGLLTDTANADVYNKALTAQSARVKKFGDLVTQSMGGGAAATAAPTAGS